MKIMSTSFKRSHACTAALSAPNPVAGHCLSTSLPETPGHSQASLGQSLVGSLLLYPGSWCTQGFVCTPQESFFSQSCVNSGGSMVGLMQPPSRGLMPFPSLLHPEPLPLQQSTTNPYPTGDTQTSSVSVSLGVSGPWCAQGLFEPSEHLCWVWGFILNMILPLLPPCGGFSFAFGCGGISSKSFHHHTTTTPMPTILLGLLYPWTRGISSKSEQVPVSPSVSLSHQEAS